MKKVIVTGMTIISLFAFNTKYFPNLDFSFKCSQVLKKDFGTICYSCSQKKPMVVEYDLFRKTLKLPRFEREDLHFRPDYDLPKKCRAYPNDLSHSGEDRGHNCPNAAFAFSRKLQKETFLMSNIAPQAKWLNRKLWAKIERFARYEAVKYGEVEVATGSCGVKGYVKHGVVIPKWWFKVLYIPAINKYIAFLAPNINAGMKTAKIREFLVPLSEIENKCNIKISKTGIEQNNKQSEQILNYYLSFVKEKKHSIRDFIKSFF